MTSYPGFQHYIKYITVGTMVNELIEDINVVSGDVKIFNSSDEEKADDAILATGDVLRTYSDGEIKDIYQLLTNKLIEIKQ